MPSWAPAPWARSEEDDMASALVAYLHYVAMIAIAVVLVFEHVHCVPGLPDSRVRSLARIDSIYGAVAVLAIGTGVAGVAWYGKRAAFYLHNPVVHIKMALFVAVGLLSIPPTLQFLRWRRSLNSGSSGVAADYQVVRLQRYIRAELA